MLNLLDSIRTTITNIKGYASAKAISYTCDCMLSSINIASELQKATEMLSSIDSNISSTKSDISYYSGLLNRVTILSKRPKECTISDCSFIKDALEAESMHPYEKSEELQKSYDVLIDDRSKQEKK